MLLITYINSLQLWASPILNIVIYDLGSAVIHSLLEVIVHRCWEMQTLRYFRYKSFSNVDEFRKELRTVNPFKIDVGAVYNVKPKDHKAFKSFSAEEREVVFDIDMTDYDDVRWLRFDSDTIQISNITEYNWSAVF